MCLFLAKKKDKKVEEEKDDFNIDIALKEVNPFLLEGFKRFILNKDVKTKKEFDKLLKEYGG